MALFDQFMVNLAVINNREEVSEWTLTSCGDVRLTRGCATDETLAALRIDSAYRYLNHAPLSTFNTYQVANAVVDPRTRKRKRREAQTKRQ